jgi:hypothetical protein
MIDRGYRLIVTIAVMVIIGNLGSISLSKSSAILAEHRDTSWPPFNAWNIVLGFSLILNTAFPVLANWVFAFEYFKISCTMPCALANQEVPPEMIKS